MPFNPDDMFSPERVVDLKATTKDAVLEEMVDVLARSKHVTDRDDLLRKILERERTLSTGVGVGLALPHVKIPTVKDFVIGIGRHREGVDFDSIDKQPVHIVVMIGCHEAQSADYMKVLSKLVRALKEKDFQEKVMEARRGEEVVDLFVGPGGVFST